MIKNGFLSHFDEFLRILILTSIVDLLIRLKKLFHDFFGSCVTTG